MEKIDSKNITSLAWLIIIEGEIFKSNRGACAWSKKGAATNALYHSELWKKYDNPSKKNSDILKDLENQRVITYVKIVGDALSKNIADDEDEIL